MVESKAVSDDFRGPMNDPAGRLQVGEGQAGDRLIAERVEPVGWQLQLPGDRGRLAPGRQGCRIAAPSAG